MPDIKQISKQRQRESEPERKRGREGRASADPTAIYLPQAAATTQGERERDGRVLLPF